MEEFVAYLIWAALLTALAALLGAICGALSSYFLSRGGK